MKVIVRGALVFVVALTLVALWACVNNYKLKSAEEYFCDALITTKVKVAILDEPSLYNAGINVETYKAMVQLSGFVRSQSVADKAEKIAADVEGVKNIYNDMHIR